MFAFVDIVEYYCCIVIFYCLFNFTLYAYSRVGEGNLLLRHSVSQISRNCVLKSGIQRHFLSYYQSEQMKITHSSEKESNPNCSIYSQTSNRQATTSSITVFIFKYHVISAFCLDITLESIAVCYFSFVILSRFIISFYYISYFLSDH